MQVAPARSKPLQPPTVRGCDEPFAWRGPAAAWTASGPGPALRGLVGGGGGGRPRGGREGGGHGRPRRPAAPVLPVLAAASPAAGSAVLGAAWISSMPQARSCSRRRAPVRRRPAPFPRSPERPPWIATAAEKSARRHSVSCCPQCLLSGRRPRLTCPLRPQARLALVVGVAPSRPQGACRRRLRTLTGHRRPPCDHYGAAAVAAERRATAQRPSES